MKIKHEIMTNLTIDSLIRQSYTSDADMTVLVLSLMKNVYNRKLLFLSEDRKVSIGSVKAKSIRILTGDGNKYSFVWSDYSRIGDTGTSFSDMKVNMNNLDTKGIDFDNFLKPKILLNCEFDIGYVLGLYCKTVLKHNKNVLLEVGVGHKTHEFFEFDLSQVEWKVEQTPLLKNDEMNKFMTNALNYNEKGVEFESTNPNIKKCASDKYNGCNFCNKTQNDIGEDVKFYTCSGCRQVKYCDTECQKQDWNKHKIFCKNFTK